MVGNKPWCSELLSILDDRLRARLRQLSERLGEADWLDGAFSAGDLLMVSVLLRLKSSPVLEEFPALDAYIDPAAVARPAYKRAFAAQLRVNAGEPPTRQTDA